MLLPRTDDRSWCANVATPTKFVFTHACGYYSRAATISLAKLQVRLLFEGGYYSGCGFYSNKYGISYCTCCGVSYNNNNYYRRRCQVSAKASAMVSATSLAMVLDCPSRLPYQCVCTTVYRVGYSPSLFLLHTLARV